MSYRHRKWIDDARRYPIAIPIYARCTYKERKKQGRTKKSFQEEYEALQPRVLACSMI